MAEANWELVNARWCNTVARRARDEDLREDELRMSVDHLIGAVEGLLCRVEALEALHIPRRRGWMREEPVGDRELTLEELERRLRETLDELGPARRTDHNVVILPNAHARR